MAKPSPWQLRSGRLDVESEAVRAVARVDAIPGACEGRDGANTPVIGGISIAGCRPIGADRSR